MLSGDKHLKKRGTILCLSRGKLECQPGLPGTGDCPARPSEMAFEYQEQSNLGGSGSCFARLCCLCIDRENMSEQLSGSLGKVSMKPFLNKQRSRVAGCLDDKERDRRLLACLRGSLQLGKSRLWAKHRVGGLLLLHVGSMLGSQSTSQPRRAPARGHTADSAEG